jgi:cyclophilin family peptidyl-prolyl cis-trans isomerase
VLKRVALLCALLLVSALAMAACGDDSDDGSSTAADEGTATCEEVEAPAPKDDVKLKAPSESAPTATGVTFETSCGSFTVTFDDRAPKTAASFEYLAEEGFYDDTVFHRVAQGFVIQGGDPLGSSEDPTEVGTGGPGYTVDEKPPSSLSYTKGTVAMAKTAVEPPGRSGSQFYVVTAADAGLPPDYALVGEVSEGMEVVEAIEALGPPGADGAPSMPVVVSSATPVGG